MIFVTLGTQDKPFTRLLDAIQKQIDMGNITEEVIVQAGLTTYSSKQMKIFDLIAIDQFDTFINACDILITHGGVGSIITGLKLGKKVIAAPRLHQYGEHTNDHQIQIIENFSKQGYILGLTDFDLLDVVLKNAQDFQPKPFVSNTDHMIALVKERIDMK